MSNRIYEINEVDEINDLGKVNNIRILTHKLISNRVYNTPIKSALTVKLKKKSIVI